MHAFAIISLAVALHLPYADSVVVGAFVVPHGGIALDPYHTRYVNDSVRHLAHRIHLTLVSTSQNISSLNSDLILLSTPHGLADTDRFLLYTNAKADGATFPDNCTDVKECEYKLSLTLAANRSIELMEKLKKSHKVSGISGFGPPGGSPQEKALPLGWGEIIPLYFIPTINQTKTIILSHPSKRYSNSTRMIPELLHLGRSLFLRLEHMREKVVVVISADLAHTHSSDGPYGFSPAAQPFDDAVGQWAQKLKPHALLETAAGLAEDAKSCGFTGLVMLHAMLSEAGLRRWNSTVLVNGHPTYYGMMVAHFMRTNGPMFAMEL